MSETLSALDRLAQSVGWVAFGPGTELGTPRLQAEAEDAVRAVLRNAHITRSDSGDVSIVTEKAWGAAKAAVDKIMMRQRTESVTADGVVRAAAAALLGDVEVATEVMAVCPHGQSTFGDVTVRNWCNDAIYVALLRGKDSA